MEFPEGAGAGNTATLGTLRGREKARGFRKGSAKPTFPAPAPSGNSIVRSQLLLEGLHDVDFELVAGLAACSAIVG